MKKIIILQLHLFIFLFILPIVFSQTHALTFVSDNSWIVYETYDDSNNNINPSGNAEEVNFPGTSSYPNILPESKWIWAPGLANSSLTSDLTQYFFSKRFIIPNNTDDFSGSITLVVDDLAEVFVNGTLVGSHGSIDDVNLSGNYEKKIDFDGFLHSGENVINIRVQNGPASFSGANCFNCTWQENPAGVIFSINIDANDVVLPVPSFLQTSEPWQSYTYDGAQSWSPSAKTIKQWGCALTSYTMILRYFGINKLPNGLVLDPGTLNTWLKNNYGYIDGKSSGLVNPIAISILSKVAKSINNISSFDALEFSRISGNNFSALTDSIHNKVPAILDVGGHFVVARGTSKNTFLINDPYYQDRTHLTSYNNTFSYFNKFSPSNTDLSYIMIVGDQSLTFNLVNSSHHAVGEEFLMEPIINEETNLAGGRPIKVILFSKPDTSQYSLSISGNNKRGNFQIFLYDKDGNFNFNKYSFNTKGNKSYTLQINYNKNNSKKSKIKDKYLNVSQIFGIKLIEILNKFID